MIFTHVIKPKDFQKNNDTCEETNKQRPGEEHKEHLIPKELRALVNVLGQANAGR